MYDSVRAVIIHSVYYNNPSYTVEVAHIFPCFLNAVAFCYDDDDAGRLEPRPPLYPTLRLEHSLFL